jgi:hypothetical protein
MVLLREGPCSPSAGQCMRLGAVVHDLAAPIALSVSVG